MDSRERAQKWIHDNMGKYTGELTRNLTALIDEVRKEERERCAGVCEEHANDYSEAGLIEYQESAEGCAAAIRGMTDGPN